MRPGTGACAGPPGGAHQPAMSTTHAAVPPEPRRYDGVNWLGLRTLYLKEVRRFMKVFLQTVGAPVITSLLYMMIFVVATRGAGRSIEGVAFVDFIAPGLMMMTLMNNAFANSSSSLIGAKMMGLTSDLLTPPLTPGELLAGFVAGASTRGVMVAVATGLAVLPFASLGLAHLWAVLFFGLGACAILAMMGILAGLWAEKFDHLATVTNFVVLPMTFLSGTFYTVDNLPEPFRTASHLNPFFYLIDGFRYGFLDRADGSVGVGVLVTLAMVLGLGALCWRAFTVGYRLKT